MSQISTFVDEFREKGAFIAKNVSLFEVGAAMRSELRGWLEDAPQYAQPKDMARWGKLLHCWLNDWQLLPGKVVDASPLTAYFESMVRLSPDQWLQVEPTDKAQNTGSAYEAFHHLSQALLQQQGNKAHPFIKACIASNPSIPNELLPVLARVQSLAYADAPASLRGTPQGALLRVLWPLLRETNWRPNNSAVYAEMWSVNDIGSSPHDAQSAAQLAKWVPSQNAHMLQALLNTTNIAPESLLLFFPLDVGTCDAYSVLDPLIGILTEGGVDDPTYKARIVSEQLCLHNPELSSLLQMHLTLFPEASETNTMADLLAPAFNALYGREVEPPLVLTGDFFGDATGQPNGVSA